MLDRAITSIDDYTGEATKHYVENAWILDEILWHCAGTAIE